MKLNSTIVIALNPKNCIYIAFSQKRISNTLQKWQTSSRSPDSIDKTKYPKSLSNRAKGEKHLKLTRLILEPIFPLIFQTQIIVAVAAATKMGPDGSSIHSFAHPSVHSAPSRRRCRDPRRRTGWKSWKERERRGKRREDGTERGGPDEVGCSRNSSTCPFATRLSGRIPGPHAAIATKIIPGIALSRKENIRLPFLRQSSNPTPPKGLCSLTKLSVPIRVRVRFRVLVRWLNWEIICFPHIFLKVKLMFSDTWKS